MQDYYYDLLGVQEEHPHKVLSMHSCGADQFRAARAQVYLHVIDCRRVLVRR